MEHRTISVLFIDKLYNITHPVCLSPMINSRCPLPIGTNESTALIPVCIGSLTEILGMIPGAFTPTRALTEISYNYLSCFNRFWLVINVTIQVSTT